LQVRALSPKSSDMRATASVIAPKLAERHGLAKLTGPRYDKAVIRMSDADAKAVTEAEEAIPTDAELTGAGPRMLSKIDQTITRLKGLTANNPAVIQLLRLRKDIAALGEHPNARAAIDLRRKMDKFVEDHGGFKQASISADRTNLIAHRAGGNVLRGELNGADPRLASANANYHVSRAGADIIEDRYGRTVGATSTPRI